MSTDDEKKFLVLVNTEEQYSLWPSHLEIPKGWDTSGFSGDSAACMAYVDQVWTDMRPLSLRKLQDKHSN